MDKFRLDGKIAVVTGALGLLGPVWIRGLLEAGAVVAAIDLSKTRVKENFLKLTTEFKNNLLKLYKADITKRKQVEKVLEKIKNDLGIPTILVNNAGIDQPPSTTAKTYYFEHIPFEVGKKILEVNVLGTFLMTQVFGSEMSKIKNGSIINIASMYAEIVPDPKNYTHIKTDPPFLKPPLYGPSKAALLNLTKYTAVHWGKNNIRVNAISPGAVFNNQDIRFRRKIIAKIPLGRMAFDDDLPGSLVFLASDASKYITGQNIQIDGGITVL